MRAALVAVALLLLVGCAEKRLKTDDGRSRIYRLHVPAGVETPAPLVLALHGGGGTAKGTQELLGLDALADEEGFIVAYPEGISERALGLKFATWNSDEECCGIAREENVDDVAFLSQLIDHLVEKNGVDPARVYATGLSNGGNMSHRLGCELAEKMAAIAPMGAPQVIAGCAPAAPVPTMIVHGVLDDCATFEDAEFCGGCFARALEEEGIGTAAEEDRFADCEGARTQAALWRGFNGCGEAAEISYEVGGVTCETFSEGCEAEVTLCTVENGGHTVPGTSHGCDPEKSFCQTYMSVVGPVSDDISLREVWAFFEAHRR